MTLELSDFRFVAKALPNKGQRPRELARTMPAHPLSYMELPHDPEYTLYNSRLTPEALSTASDDEMYWAVRTNVIFRHTGELPIEISGPDAETLLNKVFTRNVSRVKPGRCSYQFACYHDRRKTEERRTSSLHQLLLLQSRPRHKARHNQTKL